ncbi:MAG: 2-polyprenyl-3-methyl-6-methoxy-1,4-benzoquinone monooxygenase [Burkholderiales bacterium]
MRLPSLDRFIVEFDRGLRTVFGKQAALRETPGRALDEAGMSVSEKRLAASLMRVNHCGEVSAQALYHGQSVTARDPELQHTLQQAAREEIDHLAWCESRIAALGGRKSLLNPFWYTASFTIGAVAGLLGDRWNLGFLAETERQVVHHLETHLMRLPEADTKSRAVLEQMCIDEARHATTAFEHGAEELPAVVKTAMRFTARGMTETSFYF